MKVVHAVMPKRTVLGTDSSQVQPDLLLSTPICLGVRRLSVVGKENMGFLTRVALA